MLENGAMTECPDNTNYPNALFSAVNWICSDGIVTDNEIEVVALLIYSGANTSTTELSGAIPYDYLIMRENLNNVDKSEKNVKALEMLLKS